MYTKMDRPLIFGFFEIDQWIQIFKSVCCIQCLLSFFCYGKRTHITIQQVHKTIEDKVHLNSHAYIKKLCIQV